MFKTQYDGCDCEYCQFHRREAIRQIPFVKASLTIAKILISPTAFFLYGFLMGFWLGINLL